MTIGEHRVGDVVVIDVEGEMTRDKGYGSVKKRVGELLDQGHLSLLLNLCQVPYINSSGVGEIASTFITVRNRNGSFKIAASLSRVTKLLTISRLDSVIDVFDTEAEALQSFDPGTK